MGDAVRRRPIEGRTWDERVRKGSELPLLFPRPSAFPRGCADNVQAGVNAPSERRSRRGSTRRAGGARRGAGRAAASPRGTRGADGWGAVAWPRLLLLLHPLLLLLRSPDPGLVVVKLLLAGADRLAVAVVVVVHCRCRCRCRCRFTVVVCKVVREKHCRFAIGRKAEKSYWQDDVKQ